MAVIYRITNMENGHYYVGSAESFARREWSHKYELRKGTHKNPRLQAAWNKYGEEMFVFEVLETVPEGVTAFEVENKYLAECVGKPDCYNINTNAFVPRLGVMLSDEAKQNISRARKGKHAGQNHYRYGKTLAEEIRAKISASQKGKANPRKGQRMSEHGRANVAAAVKRGAESHFYGKRPENADGLQRAIVATLPDRSLREFKSLTELRDTMGVSIATIIRACKSGNPVKCGAIAGWVLSYKDEEQHVAPIIPTEYAHLPRSRQQAKQEGAKQYFTGLPCERGHIAVRSTKGTCIECRREDDKVAYEKKRLSKP